MRSEHTDSGAIQLLAWGNNKSWYANRSISFLSSARQHHLLVFEPNRPWDFHCAVTDRKSSVTQLEWSVDGAQLLALDENGVVHIWRKKSQSINVWVCAHKQECSLEPESRVVHAAWLDHKPMVTINHMKKEWPEVMEFQPFSPHLRLLLGNSFISVHSSGKVEVTSANVTHDSEVTATTKLKINKPIVKAKTLVTPNGTVLCVVGCEGGQVRVFTLSVTLCQGSGFTVTASFADSFTPTTSQAAEITDLLMLPHSDGCVVHVCYNGAQLYHLSVNDLTRTGSYQTKRDHAYSCPWPVRALAASSLCLGSCDAASENDIIMYDNDSDAHSEGKWPVEVLVIVGEEGGMIAINRDSYKPLSSCAPPPPERPSFPASKKHKAEPPSSSTSSPGKWVVTLSPNACCVAVANRNIVRLYQAGGLILGLKDPTVPVLPRCGRLLSMATVAAHFPWDWAVVCGRLEAKQGGAGFLKKVLAHYVEDFRARSSTLQADSLAHYFTTCSLLNSCLEDGLPRALSYRSMARLHGTASLLNLCLPASKGEEGGEWPVEVLQGVCASKSSEDSLESITSGIETKEFVIPPGVASQLQGHVHWIIEYSIDVVAAIVAGNSTNIPDPRGLELLRELLVLVYIWNKALPQPILSVTDGALCLLFKGLTKYMQSPSAPLPEELQSELSSNIPAEKYPALLTLTKAAHLQGFISGLATHQQLPEAFKLDVVPPLRPHVQRNYTSIDPYSPLSLVVPRDLSPPWRDCFTEGQRDVVHGGVIMKNVVQNARLKQCSRCRSWTVASESLQSSEELTYSGSPVQQWRGAWSATCLCGAPWTSRTSKRI